MASTHPYIGERIRSHREARGWDLRELGRRARISFGQIGRWERREADPSFGMASRLAGAFEIEVWRLWDVREHKGPRALRRRPAERGGSVADSSTIGG